MKITKILILIQKKKKIKQNKKIIPKELIQEEIIKGKEVERLDEIKKDIENNNKMNVCMYLFIIEINIIFIKF